MHAQMDRYMHGWTDACTDVEVEMIIQIKPNKFINDPYPGHSISSFSEVARPKKRKGFNKSVEIDQMHSHM